MPTNKKLGTAAFGAGCFWHVQTAFDKVPGVVGTMVGYMGGTYENPTYEDVCSDATGHVEVVQVTFDPKRVSYTELLKAFWEVHDPTQVNRQGFDIGTQYRSVIFYYNESQRKAAEKAKKEKQKEVGKPISTSIEKAATFYKAEEYHQKYLAKKGVFGKVIGKFC